MSVSDCASCAEAQPLRLTYEDFIADVERGNIINARNGGLVLGRDGPDDDIPLIKHVQGGVYQPVGLMQGAEYLMSVAATEAHMARLHEINAETGEAPLLATLPLTPLTSVINTNLGEHGAWLWIGRAQFVINRYATAAHLEELEMLNATV